MLAERNKKIMKETCRIRAPAWRVETTKLPASLGCVSWRNGRSTT